MSDSAFEHARNEHVPVDEFIDFTRGELNCENCGSYSLAEREQLINRELVVFYACEECGDETHSEDEQAIVNRRQHFKPGYGTNRGLFRFGLFTKVPTQ